MGLCRSPRCIVHFTGYELTFDQIRARDPRDRKVGHLLARPT